MSPSAAAHVNVLTDDAAAPLKIVFPQGLVLDNDRIHVSYGKDDKAIQVMTVEREGLLRALQVPVD